MDAIPQLNPALLAYVMEEKVYTKVGVTSTRGEEQDMKYSMLFCESSEMNQ